MQNLFRCPKYLSEIDPEVEALIDSLPKTGWQPVMMEWNGKVIARKNEEQVLVKVDFYLQIENGPSN